MTTLEKIYARCEEEGDCLIWTGYATKTHRQPFWSRTSVRDLVWELKNGQIPEGKVPSYFCENPLCLEHLKLYTRKAITHRTSKQGKFNTPERIANITLGRRKNAKYPQELVDQIRKSQSKISSIAKEFNVSRSYVYKVKNGMRPSFDNPFSGLFTGLMQNGVSKRRA